jgi:hypothetical protein
MFSTNLFYNTGFYEAPLQSQLFVAGGNGVDFNAAYSEDGATWTGMLSGTSLITSVNGVAFDGTKWVAVGLGVNKIIYSTDGINWLPSTNGNTVLTSTAAGVATNGSRWIVAASGLRKLIYSDDGITWTATTNGNVIFRDGATEVAWSGIRWIACTSQSSSSTKLAYSNDGLVWTASSQGSSLFDQVYSVASNGTQYLALGRGTFSIAYSSDGITWTGSTSANTLFGIRSANCAAWNGTRWVAGGNLYNPLVYSTDGITWSASSNGSTFYPTDSGPPIVTGITWNGEIFVAVGGYRGFNTNYVPVIVYSSDGITWTDSTNGTTVFEIDPSSNLQAVASNPSTILFPPTPAPLAIQFNTSYYYTPTRDGLAPLSTDYIYNPNI